MQSLLFLPHRIPFPPHKGDKVRSYHLLKFLAQRYRVYLGTFIDDPADVAHIDRVKAFCADAHFARLHPSRARVRGLRGFFSNEPLTLPYYRDKNLARWIDETIAQHSITRVLVFSSCMAQFLPPRRSFAEIIDFIDVDSDKWRQYATRHRWPMSAVYAREARLLLDWERAIAARAAYSLFTTPVEAELFASLAPTLKDRVVAVGNGVDTVFFAPNPSARSPYGEAAPVIVFSGAMDYWPNVDAVTWFAREALPKIAATVPEVRFYVVGMNPAPAVRALAASGKVVVTGRVDDVRPYLQHADVVVAPLRVARGVQNKVLEAMAMERAVVASDVCMAPLSASPGVDLEVADSAVAFAQKTIELLRLARRRETIGAAARDRVERDYSWDRNLNRVALLLEDAARTQARPRAALGARIHAATADKARA